MDEEIVLTQEQKEELSDNKGGPENMPEVTIIAEGGPDDA